MFNKLEDKRQFERLRFKTPLRSQVRGTAGFENSISDDISIGGIGYTSDTFIKPDTLVALDINLLSKVLHPVGRVAWVNSLPYSGKFRMGVEFLELESGEKGYLADYLKMRLQK